MEFKFSKSDEEGAETQPAAEKKNQSALLVLLLLLVGGFSYVYFFTGLIKSQEAPKPAEAPVKAQVVKMPLPPSDGGTGKDDAKPADAKKDVAAAPKVEPAKAPAAPATAAAPAAKPKEEPKKAEAAKPKEEPKKAEPKKAEAVKPKEEPKKAEPAKPSDKKPAVAEKKPEPVKADPKKVTAAEPKPKDPAAKSEKPAKAEPTAVAYSGPWSVLVGLYVLEDALSADMGKVRKAGLDPVVKPGARKKSAMNRLFLADFSDRAAAQAEFDKLKRHTSDAFIVEQGGKHAVYAGSYLLDARAASETERLGAAGFKVILKRAEIAIPSQSLTVGPFSDKKSADAALGKLKAAGVKASLTR